MDLMKIVENFGPELEAAMAASKSKTAKEKALKSYIKDMMSSMSPMILAIFESGLENQEWDFAMLAAWYTCAELAPQLMEAIAEARSSGLDWIDWEDPRWAKTDKLFTKIQKLDEWEFGFAGDFENLLCYEEQMWEITEIIHKFVDKKNHKKAKTLLPKTAA